jgi:hypothetical protein
MCENAGKENAAEDRKDLLCFYVRTNRLSFIYVICVSI